MQAFEKTCKLIVNFVKSLAKCKKDDVFEPGDDDADVSIKTGEAFEGVLDEAATAGCKLVKRSSSL